MSLCSSFNSKSRMIQKSQFKQESKMTKVWRPILSEEGHWDKLGESTRRESLLWRVDTRLCEESFLYAQMMRSIFLKPPEILKKFDFASVKTASTPIETQKPLVKDEEATNVDVHLYRSMIGSLMYLTASRPDIMFAVCACSRYQVTPKISHLNVVKN
ncbi:hypothetical protein Tco_0452540 [Tanacetum coccineum]